MSEAVEQSDLREGYQEVKLGPKLVKIPPEWDVRKLDELTKNSGNYGANVSAVEYDPEKPRYIRITDIGDDGFLKDNDRKSITRDDAEGYYLSAGDLLFARTGATAGKSYLCREDNIDAAYAGYLIRFELDESQADPDFLALYVQSKLYHDWVDRITRHGAQQNINASEYRSLDVLYPPLPEQRRIADILSTVDEQIQQTDEIIERTEELRFGLMTEFFHTGYNDHPLTDAPTFGQVPADWDIRELAEVAEVKMGSSPKSKHYNEQGDGLPFYQANNEFGYRNPTNDRWCSEPKKIAEEGDTLVTIRGTYVGQVNVANERCCIGRGLAAVNARGIDQEYLHHHLAHRERYVKSIASGSTFDSINSSELETLSVLIPPRDEQEKIASCLRELQEKYLKEMNHKKGLQELKRGLMQDLLTGTVRVNTD
ncbi:restriction endonuclease subunit S [Haloarcula onubensis]|uniref:Restriction endonuclease subunit S n=1 Tax=Haloarcula onubensis TaxID=2950539 RepID=A0ABU2FRU3_9EURY|nr:restriction endonuclease subunit S [Halomicroarcula sp. S3CR25-11]MDS0283490.1 restriction endonuclease subunit S [Halomicroarcula sp. S3CR25-11]